MPTTPRPKRTNGNGSSPRPRPTPSRRPARASAPLGGPDDGAEGTEGASSLAESVGDRIDTLQAPEVPSEDVLEFLKAVDDYKRKAARPFPSLSEYLRILRGLGYRKS